MLNCIIPVSSGIGLALDFMSLAVLVPLMISLTTERSISRSETKCLFYMVLTNCAGILCDIAADLTWGAVSTRVSKLFLVSTYAFIEICIFLFILYQYMVLSRRTFISEGVVYGGAFVLGVIIILYMIGAFQPHTWFLYLESGSVTPRDTYVIPVVINSLVGLFSFFLSLSCRTYMQRRELLGWCLFMIIPAIALIVTPSGPAISSSLSVSILVLFVVIHNGNIQNMLVKENELDKSQMKLMVSQIQPHFMYNSLNSIYYLIGKEPDTAKKAVSVFSDYLRQNVNSLKSDAPVTFEEEINHTKAYLYLEQLRFGDELSVEFDLQETDFRIPPLTVQPLVENAVKHGVSVKPGGGNIRVSSSKNDEGFVIVIADNGVGFKVGDFKGAGAHIGLMNVHKRLESMCMGSLDIESQEGIGTICTVRLPLEGQNDL